MSLGITYIVRSPAATTKNPGYCCVKCGTVANRFGLQVAFGALLKGCQAYLRSHQLLARTRCEQLTSDCPHCSYSPAQIMVKGKGIFVNPASASAPAKLRVLYEVGPIAYLIEKAGGKSSDGENSALDIQIPNTEVRNHGCIAIRPNMLETSISLVDQKQLWITGPTESERAWCAVSQGSHARTTLCD